MNIGRDAAKSDWLQGKIPAMRFSTAVRLALHPVDAFREVSEYLGNRANERVTSKVLDEASGVIHVGANTGQEREEYAKHGLRVIWVEPIPDVFAQLRANIAAFPEQRAVQGLVTDRNDGEYNFHVASNQGASSSILELGLHRDIWPEITYEKTITLRSRTLTSLLEDERIAVDGYDLLVLDTQGSELMVLRGAEAILSSFRFIKLEVPDFESYVGCPTRAEMTSYLSSRGFAELARHKFAERARGGAYYDIVYRRRA